MTPLSAGKRIVVTIEDGGRERVDQGKIAVARAAIEYLAVAKCH